MKASAIIACAGIGRRMSFGKNKLFVKLAGKEAISYVLEVLQKSKFISEVIIVAGGVSAGRFRSLVRRYKFTKVKKIVKGGAYRAESVFNGFKALAPGTDIVLIHDGARPFINESLIKKVLYAAARYGAAIAAVPVKPTIKVSDPKGKFVRYTPDRRYLWEAQTPQAFKANLLRQVYKKTGARFRYFTDEASLLEDSGIKVALIRSGYNNIKITTDEDLITAGAICSR